MAYASKTGLHGAFVETPFLALDHVRLDPWKAPKVSRVVLPAARRGIGFAEGRWARSMCTFQPRCMCQGGRASVFSCVFESHPNGFAFHAPLT
jgi:hypothetical protein